MPPSGRLFEISGDEAERCPMQRIWLLLLLACGLTSAAAQETFNPYTRRWERSAPPSPSLQYNPYSRQLQTAPPNSAPQYNPNAGSWQLAPRGSVSRFNPDSGRWEMAPADAPLQYD